MNFQTRLRYALVGVFVADGPAGIRVAVTGAGQGGVFRVPEMESALSSTFSADAIANVKVSRTPECGYPCKCRLSRASDYRDGETGRRKDLIRHSFSLQEATGIVVNCPRRLDTNCGAFFPPSGGHAGAPYFVIRDGTANLVSEVASCSFGKKAPYI